MCASLLDFSCEMFLGDVALISWRWGDVLAVRVERCTVALGCMEYVSYMVWVPKCMK